MFKIISLKLREFSPLTACFRKEIAGILVCFPTLKTVRIVSWTSMDGVKSRRKSLLGTSTTLRKIPSLSLVKCGRQTARWLLPQPRRPGSARGASTMGFLSPGQCSPILSAMEPIPPRDRLCFFRIFRTVYKYLRLP